MIIFSSIVGNNLNLRYLRNLEQNTRQVYRDEIYKRTFTFYAVT